MLYLRIHKYACVHACLHAAISNTTSHKSTERLRMSSHCFRALLALFLHTKDLFHVAGSAAKSERIAIGISITKALTVAHLGLVTGAVVLFVDDFHTNSRLIWQEIPKSITNCKSKLRHILHRCQVLLQHLETWHLPQPIGLCKTGLQSHKQTFTTAEIHRMCGRNTN